LELKEEKGKGVYYPLAFKLLSRVFDNLNLCTISGINVSSFEVLSNLAKDVGDNDSLKKTWKRLFARLKKIPAEYCEKGHFQALIDLSKNKLRIHRLRKLAIKKARIYLIRYRRKFRKIDIIGITGLERFLIVGVTNKFVLKGLKKLVAKKGTKMARLKLKSLERR
ncbi:MAG: hypothetical protein KKF65_02995, partial [Nanoarchaeota archaeon]|nr:hypothetical protein [Nanoarchaeota archaeon]